MTEIVGVDLPAGVDLARLVGQMPDALVLVRSDGIICWAAPSITGMLGWGTDELVGLLAFDLFAKSVNRPLHDEAFEWVLSAPGLHGPFEVTIVGADGSLHEVELMVTNALLDPDLGVLVASCREITDRDSDLEELRQSEAWATSLLRGATDLIVVCDRVGRIVYMGPSTQRILHRDPTSMVGRIITDYVHADDVLQGAVEVSSVDQLLGTGLGRRPLVRFQHADGSWKRLRVERSVTEPVSEHAILLTGRDLDEDARAADLLSEQTVLLERIARGAPVTDTLRSIERLAAARLGDGHLIIGFFDPSGDFRSQADAVDQDLIGILERTGIIRPTGHPDDAEAILSFRHDEGWDAVLWAASGNLYRTAWVCDLEAADGNRSGRLTLLRHHPAPLTNEELDMLGLVADLATIAIERHDLQARLAYGAMHDELTGLPNRRLLLARLSEMFSTPESKGGLLFVDVDRFKLINDSLGHDAGDQLLQEITVRFVRTLRPADLVARVGGDEFVVLCPDLEDVDAVARVAERLMATLSEPVDLPGGRVVVSASIGVAHRRGGAEPTAVLQDADMAMYEAKQKGRNQVALFHAGLRERAVARLEVENALRDAIRFDEMQLHYQPVIRLRDRRMVGVEALLRWQRPGLGMVQPNAFVPVATDTGLILPLGRWVIEQAVEAAARWPDLEVAANLSARQLTDADLVDFVAEVLEREGVWPGRLCLEVTEADLITDTPLVVDQLARFKKLGVRLAIDDFGTGFATLDYLRRFASADILKVDASFVAGVTDPSSHDLAIVSAAMILADNLGFDVVAEGVETEEQREVLERLGCGMAQGYLFSRPVAASEIDEMLRIRDLPL